MKMFPHGTVVSEDFITASMLAGKRSILAMAVMVAAATIIVVVVIVIDIEAVVWVGRCGSTI